MIGDHSELTELLAGAVSFCGATISFVDESSASGYYYPATQLQQLSGLDPFSDIDAQFAGGHPNSVLNVFNGEISVGVSFDDARQDVYEEEETVGEEVVSRFHGCYLSAF